MYVAGVFDFSAETAGSSCKSAQHLLRFPARVPLESLEGACAGPSGRARPNAAPAVAAALTTNPDASPKAVRGGPEISAVATGQRHMLCVVGGVLCGMGCNKSRQLGGGTMPPQAAYLRALPFASSPLLASPVVAVACGKRHSLLLTAAGEVYATGDNSNGQLGVSGRDPQDWAAVRVGANNVEAIAAGPDTSFALTRDGHVYAWGHGGSLTLGQPSQRIEALDPSSLLEVTLNIDTPTRIDVLAGKRIRITALCPSNEHLVLRDDTEVYTCGRGSFGRLGHGDLADHYTPTRVTFPPRKVPERLLDIAAASASTAVLRHNPDFGSVVYVFGREGTAQDGTFVPRMVAEAPHDLVRIGGGFGGNMFTAISEQGRLFTWGQHSCLKSLMLTNDMVRKSPSPVTAFEERIVVRSVAASGGSLVVVLADVAATVQRFGPAALLRDIIVPYGKRLTAASGGGALGVDHHDEAVATFFRQMLGAAAGDAYVTAMEKPPPEAPPERPSVVKRGTASLHIGAKVRVWMSDVYAMGTVTNDDPLNLKAVAGTPKKAAAPQRTPSASQVASSPNLAAATASIHNHSHAASSLLDERSTSMLELPAATNRPAKAVEVTWVRHDWDPEIVELHSDDETLDEENENRWQRLWFTGPPTNNSGKM